MIYLLDSFFNQMEPTLNKEMVRQRSTSVLKEH